ncbi:MAG: type II secretion system F family protein [Bacteroidales bacterium]|nr:type II secretion system F family protein [Bacteroidales bacterium]
MSIKIDNLRLPSEHNKSKHSKNKRQFQLFERYKSKINKKRNTDFFQELNILLSSGIDIRSSLDIIIAEAKKEKDKKIFKIIRNCILSGKSLSEAIKQSQAFSPFDYYNILIGEESGNLVATLELLHKYHLKQQELNQKVGSALSYPLIVLVISVLAVTIMLKYIVPVFADVYARFGHELPSLTSFMLKLSDNLGKVFLFLLFIIFIFSFIKKQLTRNELNRKAYQNFLIRLPIIGNFLLEIHLEKLFHSFTILLNSKVNLVQSLSILRKMTNLLPISFAIKQIEKDIIYGNSLSESMKKHSQIFDIKHISIIKVGEEVNKLEFAVQKVKEQLEKRIMVTTNILTSALEPILIIFVGFIVGLVLIAMYLPMFKLSGTFF